MKNKSALIIVGVIVLLNVVFFVWSNVATKNNNQVTSRGVLSEHTK